MTKDTIQNAKTYFGIHPLFKTAFEWIAANANPSLPEGKGAIAGTDITYNCQIYATHPFDFRKFETHDKHIDIQFVIKGAENIFLGDPAAMETAVGYNPETDIRFLAGRGLPVLLTAGEFMIIWPHEAHAPGCDPAAEFAAVKKTIVKIPV